MKDVATAWLALQCRMVPGVHGAVVFLGAPDRGPYVPVAHWPEPEKTTPQLSDAAQLAMSERRGVVRAPQDAVDGDRRARDAIALPLLLDDELLGAVAVEVPHRAKAQQQTAIQLLAWGTAWFELLTRERRARPGDRLGTVLELVGQCLEHERFATAATAFATELATRLELERVSLGFVQGPGVELCALSHSARFESTASLARDIEAAMNEATDQHSTLVFPPPPDAPPRITRAQQALCQEHGASAVCTLPFAGGGRLLGALTLERSDGPSFPATTLELCEHVASLVGPILDARRRDDRWLGAKLADALREGARDLAGPRHAVLKLVGGGLLALLALLAVVPGPYRVSAEATLEGRVQRAVVAAMDGFVVEAQARAGDVVEAGATLALLDDKDLRLERLKWSSQREQTLQEYREALAGHARAEVSMLSAKVAQADAELELLDEQLARTRLTAPFDGIVVKGDLSQALGSPVERGQVLFEVAPLDAYRIILEVDEREIAELHPDQTGRLALASMPGQPLPLVVERITPVAVAEDGRNYFRVEARLEEPSDLLRPGMEGVAKIDVDRRRMLWILGHELVDWLRLRAWAWLP